MGKGIRSKSMKKNRTELRRTVILPIVNKKLQGCVDELINTKKERSGDTIEGLKNVLHSGKNSGKAMTINPDVEPEGPEKGANRITFKDRMAFITKKKVRGSKARQNGEKQLAWF